VQVDAKEDVGTLSDDCALAHGGVADEEGSIAKIDSGRDTIEEGDALQDLLLPTSVNTRY